MKFYIERIIATVALTLIYSFTWLIACLFRRIIRSKAVKKRIIINGTFHNPNWFHAHIAPICQSNYGEVILICDEEIDQLPNLRYEIPPQWMMRIFTRAGAKFIWTIKLGISHPADVFVGYHIFPSAITALIAARLTGAKAIYQVTSGQLELEGGGWNAENRLLMALGKPSGWIEHLALAVTNQFDCAIVRGQQAKDFVLQGGYQNRLEIVTGSVLTDASFMQESRDIDILFVGRLAEYKRPDRFLQVIADVLKKHPQINVAIAGDGPDRQALESQAQQAGISNNVEFLGKRSDIPNLMGRARLFVLTSRWEGVSIAMLEAMALAVVPVVGDVGDLRDFARNGETGFVISENDLPAFSETLSRLLADETLRTDLASNARELILRTCDRQVLSDRWNHIMTTLVMANSGDQ